MAESIKNLIKTNDFLTSLLNSMPTAVFIVDDHVRVQNVNKAFTKLFHKPAEEVYDELCGNAMGCVFPVKQNTDCGKTVNCKVCEIRKNIIKCLTKKEGDLTAIIEREFFIDGVFTKMHFFVTSNYLEFKGLDFVLIMVQDVTMLENQRRHLAELNDLKNKFLGMAAHDLKNPISEIMMASSLIINYSDKLKEEDKDRLIKMIHKSSNFMKNLVENLLDISTIESGKLVLDKTAINYPKFINECLILNNLIAREKSIRIDLKADENISIISFDKNRINQVINNLIDNAIKFSPENSKILVEIQKEHEKIITKVIDEGPGIPEDELSKLFQEFQKISVKPTGGERGTGLGLAISKKIVEAHKGLIGVESKVGKGTTFFFSLPLS